MSIKLQFVGDSTPQVEDMDAVNYEVAESQNSGLLVVNLINAAGKVISTHANVRSVWK